MDMCPTMTIRKVRGVRNKLKMVELETKSKTRSRKLKGNALALPLRLQELNMRAVVALIVAFVLPIFLENSIVEANHDTNSRNGEKHMCGVGEIGDVNNPHADVCRNECGGLAADECYSSVECYKCRYRESLPESEKNCGCDRSHG